MKKFITRIVLSLAFVAATIVAPLATPSLVSADTVGRACNGVKAVGGGECDGDALSAFLKRIVNILLFLVGTISVIVIIIGGIRYVTSGGDQAQITGAKNTILYAVIGVVVAVMAYAIVNFVLGSL